MKRARPNRHLGKVFRGASRGFTLIEVVIAIALIGLIGVAVLSALSTASLALIISDQRATAESLARTQMESIKNQKYSPAPTDGVGNYTKIVVPTDYSICSFDRTSPPADCGSLVLAIPWDSGNNTACDVDNGLQKITLVIKHDDEEIVVLEDYKRNPEV